MENVSDRFFKVKCPKCGAEYILGEVFFPDSFAGNPTNVFRDNNGKILYVDGDYPKLIERWTCDYCNTDFLVRAHISLDSIYDRSYDFSEDTCVEMSSLSDKENLF